MTANSERITIGATVFLTLILAVIAWWWLFFPDEQHVIALYAEHKKEFATLVRMIEGPCGRQLTAEAKAVASRIDPRMSMFCAGDGELRFVLGVRGLMTIGPERAIGLTYIPGDPERKGTVVPTLAPHMDEVGNVHLRRVDDRWYVFFQNTD